MNVQNSALHSRTWQGQLTAFGPGAWGCGAVDHRFRHLPASFAACLPPALPGTRSKREGEVLGARVLGRPSDRRVDRYDTRLLYCLLYRYDPLSQTLCSARVQNTDPLNAFSERSEHPLLRVQELLGQGAHELPGTSTWYDFVQL